MNLYTLLIFITFGVIIIAVTWLNLRYCRGKDRDTRDLMDDFMNRVMTGNVDFYNDIAPEASVEQQEGAKEDTTSIKTLASNALLQPEETNTGECHDEEDYRTVDGLPGMERHAARRRGSPAENASRFDGLGKPVLRGPVQRDRSQGHLVLRRRRAHGDPGSMHLVAEEVREFRPRPGVQDRPRHE